jgi:hypothetical protein
VDGLPFEVTELMRTFFVRVLVVLPLVFVASTAHADIVRVGDFVKFTDRAGSPGGEFGLTVSGTPGGSAIDSFVTFCLQKTEFINFTSTFVVGSINPYTLTDPNDKGGVAGKDWISAKTAWLYKQFRSTGYGELGALGYNGSIASANALQNALWYFEEELTIAEKNALAGNAMYKSFVDAAKASGATRIGNVAVLNLYKYDSSKTGGLGDEAQDQLTIVPEPSSLTLFGAGILGLCARRRRQATA